VRRPRTRFATLIPWCCGAGFQRKGFSLQFLPDDYFQGSVKVGTWGFRVPLRLRPVTNGSRSSFAGRADARNTPASLPDAPALRPAIRGIAGMNRSLLIPRGRVCVLLRRRQGFGLLTGQEHHLLSRSGGFEIVAEFLQCAG